MNIRKATINNIPAIQAMAEVVFRRTYAEILSPEQMEYMMEWMYSAESLTEQIEGEGKEFFIAEEVEEAEDCGMVRHRTGRGSCLSCGYVSVEFERMLDDGRPLFHLQKIYVMPDSQGTGLGKRLFLFLVNHLKEKNPGGCRVELNVNRSNKAIGFYEKMGMRRDREGDFPIGDGFYMNDYIYAMDLNAKRNETDNRFPKGAAGEQQPRMVHGTQG